MEYSMHWRYAMTFLQMFVGASLLLTCFAGRSVAFRSFARSVELYFYSFSPAALLFYILYKVSYMF